MNLDRAIQAAGEAFNQYAIDNPGSLYDDTPQIAARIAIEAAAPILLQYTGSLHQIAQQRAERAEAEVERLRTDFTNQEANLTQDMTDLLARAQGAEAEVERLLGLGKIVEAEVEQLRKEYDTLEGERSSAVTRWKNAEAEVERLHRVVKTGQFVWREAAERAEAEVERLRGLVVEKAVEMEQQWNRAEDRAALADELAEALREARDCIESWGAYAGDYFQEKWNLAGDIAACDTALAHYEEARREV